MDGKPPAAPGPSEAFTHVINTFGSVLLAVFAATGPSAYGAAGEPAPRRIVSINVCTDQLVLLLAPRESIVAVSQLAAVAEVSPLARLAQGVPSVRGSAEEVLNLKPDLVLTGSLATRHTTKLLRSFGVPVLALPAASDFDGARKQLREVGAALHQQARAENLIRAFDASLAAARQTPWRRAAFYRQGGQSAGTGTLSDATMSAARMENVAVTAGLKGYGYVSLERLLFERPEWLIGSDYKRDVSTVGAQVSRHPAMRSLRGGTFIMPGKLIVCGGAWNADAVALLSGLGSR